MKRLFPVLCIFSWFIAGHSFAGSATWNLNPTSGDWNTAANWTPGVVPNGPADIASFDVSNTAGLSLSGNTEVNGMVFNPVANAYTIAPNPGVTLTISGAGITNSSTMAQSFVSAAAAAGSSSVILFSGSANAGRSTIFATNGSPVAGKEGGRIHFSENSSSGGGIFTNGVGVGLDGITPGMTMFTDSSTADHSSFSNEGAIGGSLYGGITQFQDTASAGKAHFTNRGPNSAGGSAQFFGSSTAQDAVFTNNTGGFVHFYETSTADHAFIVNEAGTRNSFYGTTIFSDASHAGDATIIVHGDSTGGLMRAFMAFENNASAQNATLVAIGGKDGGAGGEIFFSGPSSGGTARVELFGNGNLHFVKDTLTIGSLEGDGLVFNDRIGARLTIGTNNLSTFFEGYISSVYLHKVGTGTLTLGNVTNYVAATTILDGALLVTHHHGSATGYGPIYVNGGMLGGSGKIGGTVIVGRGQGRGAALSVGLTRGEPGLLTIQSQLTLKSDATCTLVVGNGEMTADKIVAEGVTIVSGALLSLVDLDGIVLDPGTSLKVISNTATSPIAGTFSNLPDGATITAGNNTFQANYEGGDGNDLTLTVMQ